MQPTPFKILIILLAVLCCAQAEAALGPPRTYAVPDSSGVLVEKGIEFVRTTERLNTQMLLPMQFTVDANAQWKTDWQTPEGQAHRVRQDGRWYAGVNRNLFRTTSFWLAASGEHLDDRPYHPPLRAPGRLDLFPRFGSIEPDAPFAPSQSVTSVRILRGGAGLSVNPWKPFVITAGAGPVQDRRAGQAHTGVGAWTQMAVDHWNLSGYDQSLLLEYDRETPENHNSEDFHARYEIYRDFFEGNTNRAEVSFNSLGRDVYFDAMGRSGRRTEKGYDVRDVLTYRLMKGLNINVGGDVAREKTVQTQLDAATSSLEENQAGFTSSLQGQYGKATGEVELGLRTITQTIRGDILQGHKSDLSLQGRLGLPWRSTLAVRAAVSKYSLDTRSTSNFDDRDELRYRVEAAWTKPFLKSFVYDVHGLSQLDHLVYIFSQSSANNRWTRLFLLGSSIRHQPVQAFSQTMQASVSANYQDYDYDADPRTTRSTVHRRVVLGDSVNLAITERYGMDSKVIWQREEFGRLFWDTFSEERSDETRSLTASFELTALVARSVHVGVGAMWDSRHGERFPGPQTKAQRVVFQELRSYGPTIRVEKSDVMGVFFNVNARVLRQSQLQHETRWVSIGEAVGGFRW